MTFLFCFCRDDGSLLVLVSVFSHHLVHHLFTNHLASFWQLQKVDSLNPRILFFFRSCKFIRPKNELKKKEKRLCVFFLMSPFFGLANPQYKRFLAKKKFHFWTCKQWIFLSSLNFSRSLFFGLVTYKMDSLRKKNSRCRTCKYGFFFQGVHFLDVGMWGHLEPKVIELRTKNSLIWNYKKMKPKLPLIKKLKPKLGPILILKNTKIEL